MALATTYTRMKARLRFLLLKERLPCWGALASERLSEYENAAKSGSMHNIA